ncbi:MAG: hypothetical protein IKZ47_03560 [Clostridia bacterium]|nr:hypothetical protein [Clostridia bacterium]
MQISEQKYFLAANSADGFISHFGDCYIPGSWRAYIIKGGPGTGKSGFMKHLASKAADKGYAVTLCPCSSDPDSLDAVIIEDIKTVVLDGTAPHTVEPQLPGACENIINTGEFWDGEKLFRNADGIAAAAKLNSRFHKTAAAYISAAGELLSDNLKLSRGFTDRAAAIRFARRTAAKYLPLKPDRCGSEFIRFIGGVTPKGLISFSKTVTENFKNVVIIEDKYGGASGEIMQCLRAAAIKKGLDIITLKNPLLPLELTDHILIPELSLAFVTENDHIKFNVRTRRVHARRFTFSDIAGKYKSRMLFNRKVSRELLFGAVGALKSAKEAHDTLEKFYIDSMDFEALTRFISETSEKILGAKAK